MIQGIIAIYVREMLILKRRLSRQIPSWSISPFLYLTAFSYAVGRGVSIDGHSYLEFLIPGLIAMGSMTQAFAIASEINIARFYWHIFEEFQAAPISKFAYVAGEVLAGMTRALLAIGVIMVLGFLFGVRLHYGFAFFMALLLNSFVFASLAVGLAMVVKSHADQAMLTNFIITPMAFLGGTFFPVDRLPQWAGAILNLLPLTHASKAIRAACLGEPVNLFSYVLLFIIGSLFFGLAVWCVERAKD
ncbi:ABC-type polysaccharide/polyol phosphate export permease [Desulfocicer vacuolatum DSM 3385]|uniref:Transport permease protein n=1 Tax=Desulfocicer vacuolatum DSM 3385 TaxID=1121400 RepID=A0A1W2E7P1_9BACT|nr:ABC transporter permease [Desulfocicer vacuolatum]SMD05068.1 ABC-type polysaccharide/polyol phosphate export permease [Desulfocicer vacuolatum DSM 3385]